MIPRFYSNLSPLVKKRKVLIIYGPRRVGKTTLLQNYLKITPLKYKLESGDNIRLQGLLSSQDFSQILPWGQGYQLIAIDEAQQIPNIGMGLKILVDQLPNLAVVATGSSSFDLSNQIGEPLTGRKNTIILYPISQLEQAAQLNSHELKEQLQNFLIFGSYPEVVTAKSRQEKITVIEELVNSYLLKDILSLEKVKGAKFLLNLLKLLAFQIGSEVSLNELSNNLGIDIKTVARYLDLLEKTFVLINIRGYSKNLRKEVYKKSKYYFLDNGIRNGVISQFNKPEDRNDLGQLWENFLVSERIKKQSYKRIPVRNFFWRTYQGQEVDFIEEREGKLFGFEFKYSIKKASTPPSEFIKLQEKTSYSVVNPDNYLEFVA